MADSSGLRIRYIDDADVHFVRASGHSETFMPNITSETKGLLDTLWSYGTGYTCFTDRWWTLDYNFTGGCLPSLHR